MATAARARVARVAMLCPEDGVRLLPRLPPVSAAAAAVAAVAADAATATAATDAATAAAADAAADVPFVSLCRVAIVHPISTMNALGRRRGPSLSLSKSLFLSDSLSLSIYLPLSTSPPPSLYRHV